MKTLDKDTFDKLLELANIKLRVKRDLKFVNNTSHLPDDWSDYELIAVSDRTSNAGVLLLQPYDDLYIIQYSLSKKIIDSQTGSSRSIICDLCRTWQKGTNAASITLLNNETKRNVSILCCADLLCSQHVRSLTTASKYSRAQLREDLTNDDRIERLKRNLVERIAQLEIGPVHI